MEPWLNKKLDYLVATYLEGHSYGDVFESQFLCFLETLACYSLHEKVSSFWELWKERILKKTDTLMPMNRALGEANRDQLVAELTQFRNFWCSKPKMAMDTKALIKMDSGRPTKTEANRSQKPGTPSKKPAKSNAETIVDLWS